MGNNSSPYPNSIVITGSSQDVAAANFALSTLTPINEFREMLNIATQHQDLGIEFQTNTGSFFDNAANSIKINTSDLNKVTYQTMQGDRQQITLQELIVHELQHSVQHSANYFTLFAEDDAVNVANFFNEKYFHIGARNGYNAELGANHPALILNFLGENNKFVRYENVPSGYLNGNLRGVVLRVVEQGKSFVKVTNVGFGDVYSEQCFVAGTPILMGDGSEKPIEQVRIGDDVMSFDPKADHGLGANVPKKVTRLFHNETDELVDLRGLRMTPGHMVLSDNGEWLSISQVLKQDRCIVEDRGGKPVLVRARTGVVAGTGDDTPIFVAYVDPKTNRETMIKVRAGIPSLYSRTNDVWYSVARVVAVKGGKVISAGEIIFGNEISECIDWPENSTPFDHEFQRDFIVADANGKAYMPEWVASISYASDERSRVVNGSSRNMRVVSSASPPPSGGLNRRDRRRQTALRRVK